MILQACLNGARPAGYHSALPLTPDAMADEAVACLKAGADELHVHPRGPDGAERLAAVDDTLPRLRAVCSGALIGVSTGDWIEGTRDRTLAAIAAWRALPDYASCNLAEPDAPEVMAALRARGVGIEAGLASAADAERLVGLPMVSVLFRVLIEPPEPELKTARETAEAILAVLRAAGVAVPLLLHGSDGTVWPFAAQAAARGWSTRIGLEDGRTLPDGSIAAGNADLVAAARSLQLREQTAGAPAESRPTTA